MIGVIARGFAAWAGAIGGVPAALVYQALPRTQHLLTAIVFGVAGWVLLCLWVVILGGRP